MEVGCAPRAVYVRTARPPLRIEVKNTPPYPHAVWVPGYWVWKKHRYIWNGGHWVKPRHGFHWIPGHWLETPRGWVFVEGHWKRQ